MKIFSTEFAASVAADVKTLCHAWILRRRDGMNLGLTDHDQTFSFEGVTFMPYAGAGGEAVPADVDMGDESAQITFAAIDETDVNAGLYDGARVELWLVDWQNVAARAHIRTGLIGSIAHDGAGFKAEVFGLSHLLQGENARVFARNCDANLGDARCGVVAGAGVPITCDKRFATCCNVFNNINNFRGFPHIPGNDFVLSYATQGGRNLQTS